MADFRKGAYCEVIEDNAHLSLIKHIAPETSPIIEGRVILES